MLKKFENGEALVPRWGVELLLLTRKVPLPHPFLPVVLSVITEGERRPETSEVNPWGERATVSPVAQFESCWCPAESLTPHLDAFNQCLTPLPRTCSNGYVENTIPLVSLAKNTKHGIILPI